MTNMIKHFGLLMFVAAVGGWIGHAASVPRAINYQATVNIDGTNYHGKADFKFALINSTGTATLWSNDGTSAGGGEPAWSVNLTVEDGAYQVALGDPAYGTMVPIPPAIFTNAGVSVRVWFSTDHHPFQRVEPDEPLNSVAYAMMAAAVTDGSVTSAKLADGAVTAGKLGPSAVTAANIGVGAVGSAQLAPNAAALNLQASGGLVLSDQATATNLQSAGFRKIGTVLVDGEQWITNAPFTPPGRANHLAVWTGNEMLLLGSPKVVGALTADVGVKYTPSQDSWGRLPTKNVPIMTFSPTAPPLGVWTDQELILIGRSSMYSGRYNPDTGSWQSLPVKNGPSFIVQNPSITWTGHEVLLWGGNPFQPPHHRFNLASNVWIPMSTSNQPAYRNGQTAVWTGTELIVWGGDPSLRSSSARYNLAADRWIVVTNPAPARIYHSAIWTGSGMIVWGGRLTQSGSPTATGAIYDPANGSWRAISTNLAPRARENHVAFWTGTEMIIWGGRGGSTAKEFKSLADGARYNPTTDTWSPMTSAPTPALTGQSALWTGQELIIWGGVQPAAGTLGIIIELQGPFSNIGWKYNPTTDTWRPTSFSPAARTGHSAVWTGEELIVWGGTRSALTLASDPRATELLADGGRYNPKTRRWTPLPTVNAPTARANHQAVWTGSEMILWGGQGLRTTAVPLTVNFLNTGARYNPATDSWTGIDTNAAPDPRTEFTLVWSGEEALIFGGRGSKDGKFPAQVLNSGARYNPANNSWTSLSSDGAPTARRLHSAVWSGREMMVWGGESSLSSAQPVKTGARYDPAVNRWFPISTNGAPGSRRGHLVVWTGHRMLIWGGERSSDRSGGVYDPVLNRWQPMTLTQSPQVVVGQSAVWTGEEMMVWGNQTRTLPGGRYNPDTDKWTPTTLVGAPEPRTRHQAVWTGKEMLIFGGASTQLDLVNEVASYSLATPLYLYRHP